MNWKKPAYLHEWLLFSGLCLMAIGLPLSKFLMSFSQFILIVNWLWEGNLKYKTGLFIKNKAAVLLTSLFLLHLIGLLYTSDFANGLRDVKIKLPLLFLPFILSSSPPLSSRRFGNLMHVFVFSVLISTLISVSILLGIINRPVNDIRDISIFISHIRLSLLICTSIFILSWFIFHSPNMFKKIAYTILIAWFIFFLAILKSMTGFIILLVTGFLVYIYFALSRAKISHRLIHICIILASFTTISYYIYGNVKDYYKVNEVDMNHLEAYTAYGNKYFHDINNPQKENGNYVGLYISVRELEREWEKRSMLPVNGKDEKGNQLYITLLRYMTSKNLRKDAKGLRTLTVEDIRKIEKGIANYKYSDLASINSRIHEVMWEIDNYLTGNDPSGHSVTQRLEFWKAGIEIIKENPWFGVGTGDAKNAFDQQYEKMKSPLKKEWRLQSHNQFIAIGVAFGISGMIWFFLTLTYPLIFQVKKPNYFYLTFLLIASLSMLTEDTLETQAGASFFAFFSTVFLFCYKENQ